MSVNDLYQDILLDHSRNPRSFRKISDDEAIIDEENPTCGDHIKMVVDVDAGKVSKLEVDCEGCAICTASSSIMVESMLGSSVDEARRFAQSFVEMMRGETDMDEEELGDLVALEGVREYPLRIKCATMPWHGLEAALKKLV